MVVQAVKLKKWGGAWIHTGSVKMDGRKDIPEQTLAFIMA
jgi:hypothetical protein